MLGTDADTIDDDDDVDDDDDTDRADGLRPVWVDRALVRRGVVVVDDDDDDIDDDDNDVLGAYALEVLFRPSRMRIASD